MHVLRTLQTAEVGRTNGQLLPSVIHDNDVALLQCAEADRDATLPIQFGATREAGDLALLHLVCAAMLLVVHCKTGLECVQCGIAQSTGAATARSG